MKKGFTLIELLAVIIVLAIVALIATPIVLDVVDDAKTSAAYSNASMIVSGINNYCATAEMKAQLNGTISECADGITKEEVAKMVDIGNAKILKLEFNGISIDEVAILAYTGNARVSSNQSSGRVTYLKIESNGKIVEYNGSNYIVDGEVVETPDEETPDEEEVGEVIKCVDNYCEGSSLLAITKHKDLTTGYYTFKVNHETNPIEYSVHLYVLDGEQEWTEDQIFGDANDVSDGTNYAQNMVIVKVNGNVTIAEGATVTAYSTEYGGPKGFTLYVTGELTNNGTITMTAKGAYAKGEDVYLWKNADGTYEYVPATGGSGGEKVSSGTDKDVSGKSGLSGSGRATGGGGSGAVRYADTSGPGGTGTSYSGGSGGGAAYYDGNGGSGSNYGGTGGQGVGNNYAYSVSSGVGNPAGTCASSGNGCVVSPNGTGGLLVIYADEYDNNGTITANGVTAATNKFGGGSSGGGSINIFTNQDTGINQTGVITNTRYNEILGTTTVNGGSAQGTYAYGGAGGKGTVNIGEIRNGQYYDLKEIIEQDKDAYLDSITLKGDSILQILNENNLKSGYYYFVANGVNYPVHLYAFEGNQEWTEDQIFGDAKDVSDGTNYAQNMVIVKVNGDLTLSGTLKPYSTSYGGPKGFTLYVTGKLTNNGTISNTTGAYAVGQDVYLWKNADGTYEYVPAVGGAGGGSVKGNSSSNTAGISGTSGSGRATGGGGSGAVRYTYTSGSGESGTSYSGGSGGGASYYNGNGGNGSSYGGAGGQGVGSNSAYNVSSGAGNPAGACATPGTGCSVSSNGTGGLLVIFADEYANNGTIVANGASAASVRLGGGSSGGGSVNIFTNQDTGINQTGIITDTRYNEILGTVTTKGGAAQGSYAYGGAGGNGTVNIGEIRNGQYYDLKSIIDQDKESYINSITIKGDSILQILNENNLKSGYYYFVANGVNYPVHLYAFEGNQEWTEDQIFGDANDVSDGTNYAQNMVIVKVNGDLTISGTLKPYSTAYGGPKGFTLYVTGKLTNNGTISNTTGAYAVGQDVYLWKNADGTYEYVPATGGAGGGSVKGNSSSNTAGISGTSGSGRATGGGGSGAVRYTYTSGSGGSGTSYSGGSGGGASYYNGNGGNGSSYGGAGGQGVGSNSAYNVSSGAGNPAGACATPGTGCSVSSNGTGGLLVIFADEYANNGTIAANGASAASVRLGGGSSGGGSVNIFTNQDTGINQTGIITDTRYNEILGTVTAKGGAAQGSYAYGGAGGKGTVNIGEIRNGQYYDLKEIIEQDKEAYN